jgi:putative two-component system response regulator
MRALIVDDDELSLELLQDVLQEMGYEVERAANGKQALEKLRGGAIHLVITDWEMPEMNGLELCRAIRGEDFDGYVFIIMLSSREGGQQRIDGIHAGADAFLLKPLNSEELLVSLKTAERILGLETRDLAMFALAKLSESRDPDTGAHIERVQSFARLLAQYLSTTERYSDVIDTAFVRLIFQTTPLHDIGKVAIPDSVLLKPGKLTTDEIAIMKTHAGIGASTLDASLQRFPYVQFLQMARDIALSHHERWDGTGYPQRLAGRDIPLAARIVALADVYDALTSRRVYREALSHAQAKLLIVNERGTQFDPDVVDAFLQTEMHFIAIKERFKDDERHASTIGAAAAESNPPAGLSDVRQTSEQLNDLNKRLEQLTITDDLTGLYNRRQAMHRLEEHWALCDRYQRTVAIISVDIDNFKAINDACGHSAGDLVLKQVAEIMQQCVRATDIVCRIGGEEFLIILPCQTAQEAEICANRCRERVAETHFVFNGKTIRATISAGIASRRPDMMQATDLLREADHALYAAKHAGRNVVRGTRDSSPRGEVVLAAAG